MRDEIACITCPTLVIGGTIDPVTPPTCSEAIAAAIGDNAVLHMFEGCGHGPYRDNPDGAEEVMRAFSERLRRMALALAGFPARHQCSRVTQNE